MAWCACAPNFKPRARNNPAATPATVPLLLLPRPLPAAPTPKQEPPNNSAPRNRQLSRACYSHGRSHGCCAQRFREQSATGCGGRSSASATRREARAPHQCQRKSNLPSPPLPLNTKRQIEEAIADKGLTGRVKVSATANTLMLVGKLRPAEHGALLKFMRNAPSNVHIVDDIQYDDTPRRGCRAR